ncbi:MAG: TatD family hydrolase [Limisphaera sp.]|nr:TatD family hydrolase [Limisphaera sp.]
MRLYDAHNHLQDERFAGRQADLVQACRQAGLVRMVVNGSCEEDWPDVLALARTYPEVLPSFGYHPWYVAERTDAWLKALQRHLDAAPSAVGEIGLDRWKSDLPYEGQEDVFLAQLELAAERNLPVSIHCLQAWGRLYELLRRHRRPACGFLLHSYGGPAEMVKPLADLGAYFSLPGYFAHPRKTRQQEVFRLVPLERLLIETDAPDQPLPPERQRYAWTDPRTGRPLNHPANLPAVYQFAAELREMPMETLAAQVEANFHRLFGALCVPRTSPTSNRTTTEAAANPNAPVT